MDDPTYTKFGFCTTCGVRLSPLQTRRGGFSFNRLEQVRRHRTVTPNPVLGVFIEQEPSLCLHVNIWRSGGSADDVCDECVKVGARILRDELDAILGTPASAKANARA